MADRTNDKTNGARPGAGSTASLEDEMPGAAGDLPEDEPELSAEDEPFDDSAEDDEAADEDDTPESGGRALAMPEDDEDLRITPYEASVGASGSAVARSSTRGLAVPQWMLGNAFTRFLAESYLELRKVTWPEFLVARNMTFIVIGMSIFVAVILGAADYGLTQAVQWVITHAAPAGSPAATPTPPLLPGP